MLTTRMHTLYVRIGGPHKQVWSDFGSVGRGSNPSGRAKDQARNRPSERSGGLPRQSGAGRTSTANSRLQCACASTSLKCHVPGASTGKATIPRLIMLPSPR
jgi:hypothetical protein